MGPGVVTSVELAGASFWIRPRRTRPGPGEARGQRAGPCLRPRERPVSVERRYSLQFGWLPARAQAASETGVQVGTRPSARRDSESHSDAGGDQLHWFRAVNNGPAWDVGPSARRLGVPAILMPGAISCIGSGPSATGRPGTWVSATVGWGRGSESAELRTGARSGLGGRRPLSP